MSIELKPENFGKSPKHKAKILIAQPSWEKTQLSRDETQCYKLSLTEENEKFIDCILDLGKEKQVDLIVFPEFSIAENSREKIRKWTSHNQVIVIAGSANLERAKKFYNTSTIFFEGNPYTTEKHKLSPLETSNLLGGYGPSAGTKQLYFENTPVGKLGIMICADEFDRQTRDEFLKLNFDILCVIAFQPKGKDHHQSINEIVKEANEGIYVAYTNALCNSLTDGKSAFFGNEYREGRDEYIETGLTSDDGIEKKLVEMPPHQGCLIIECKLHTKQVIAGNLDPVRNLVSPSLPFVFENGILRQLAKSELIKEKEKIAKTKSEYQPSNPPVKTFVADYIGRQTDIDYLKEFLNSPKKHFLLLYGVGGMGKSHLLYQCIKDYKGKTFSYHVVSPNEEFTLNKLFEVCLLPKPDTKLSVEEKLNQFVEKFQENNVHLILDDYYEVQLSEVKSILPKLIGIGKGKLLLISRVIPSNINHVKGDFLNHKIQPLIKDDFKLVIRNYIQDKNITLTDKEIHLIYEKAQGYPFGGQLIIDAKPYSKNLKELLNDLGKFEAEIDPEGKAYSGRILDNIFMKGNNKEIKLLCEFSALFGLSDIETVRELPSYDLILFKGLHSRKSFVDMDPQGKFSSHAMIRDFAYHRLQNKEALHLKLAKYFENKINGRNDDDWICLNEAILHYNKSPKAELYSFIYRVEKNFESRNIKGQIDKNSILKTIRNYTTLINLFPDKPAYYNELGIAYRINRQWKNAIETFERALAIMPTDVKALNELGITYRKNNQKTKAIETFERALAIDAKALPSLNELGITYRENNQKTKAIETFERALAIDAKALPSLNELGITYRENNQKTKAIETFERALAIDAKALPSLNELGITYRENNQKTKAIETFERALAIDAKALPSLNELGITYRENNQKTKAIETFERALAIDAKHLPSLNELGITYRENNQKTKAIETFERALAIDAKHLPSLNELGITYRKNNQKTKAIETFERALAIDAKALPSLNELGITYRENNQKTKAIETFERALAIDAKALPSLNELGITYRENNQKTKAIETFERALAIDAKHLPSLNELGITYRENNQLDEAIEICNQTMRITKQTQVNLNLLQIFLLFKPDKQKAKANYDVLIIPPRPHSFNASRKKYEDIIHDLELILNISYEDVKSYEGFLFLSIQYKSYKLIIPILLKLDEKFPDNSKIKSRLGKTLSNQVIGEHEKGWRFLKQAIELFKKENNNQQLQGHIIYYLYNLLNQHQLELIEAEMKTYEKELLIDAYYFTFMAHFSFAKHSSIDEAIGHFEKAIDIAEGLMKKREFAEALLRFLSEQNNPLYKKYFLKYEKYL